MSNPEHRDLADRVASEFSRRAFVAQSAAFALMGLAGCASKKPEETQTPEEELSRREHREATETQVANSVDRFGRLKRRIKRVIDDKDRASEAIERLESARGDVFDVNTHVVDFRSELARLPPAERGDPAVIEKISREHHEKIVESLHSGARTMHDLREVITEDEWGQIFIDDEDDPDAKEEDAA